MKDMFRNKTILITGGTGSFGKQFVNFLLKSSNPKKIIIYSRDEQKQYDLANKLKKYEKILRFFIGDVRDYDRLNISMEGVDLVIHAAAMKHVDIAEYNPTEAIKTNIFGAQNVIAASIKNNVKKVIALSTDKASSPINLYGATKLTSDKLFVAANNFKGKRDIKFSVVRYGNVMGSRGSVFPLFIKQKDKNFFTVTNKLMTRFHITLDESVFFVADKFKIMQGGEIFVPKIPSLYVMDIPKAIKPRPKIKIVGTRPGEKLHEEMISEEESVNSLAYRNYYVLIPNSRFNNLNITKYLKLFKGGKRTIQPFAYKSNTNKKFLSVLEIKKIIKKNLKDFQF